MASLEASEESPSGSGPATAKMTPSSGPAMAARAAASLWKAGSSKYEVLRDLLWPNEERSKQFEKLAGAPPDAKAIFKSNEFYKMWCRCFEEDTLTEKDIQFLFASAITAQTAGKIAIDFKRKRQNEDDGFTVIAGGKKRKHSPEAVESEDEEEDITDENIHDFEMVPRQITFAVVAAGNNKKKTRPKTQSDYLLHVFKSADERLPISREEFREIEKSLTRSLKLSLLEDDITEYPLVDWMAFGAEVGLVAAEDARSMQLIKNMIAKISLGGDIFRGWEKEELYVTLSVRLPASLRDVEEYPDDFILLAMRKLNPVLQSAEHFSHSETLIVKPKEITNKFLPADFRVYKFKVDYITLDRIKAAGGKLHVVTAKATVNRGKEPLCQVK